MNFKVENVGQFKEAAVEFGDLTLLVGAQGTGKSIFLQLFKLVQDQEYVKNAMSAFGQGWDDEIELMEAYLGKGMGQIWSLESHVFCDEKNVTPFPQLPSYHPLKRGGKIYFIPGEETVYYIPAQRVLTMLTGWPRPSWSYTSSDPFVVKDFSENIRRYLELLEMQEALPFVSEQLKTPFQGALNEAIFHGASVSRNLKDGQKEVRLNVSGDDKQGISYMAWSTGQREFFPLLLAYHDLLPLPVDGKMKQNDVKWVIIEEPEMGLHPMGIFAVMALVLDLLSRGYKVVISTHSSNVLDIVWAMEAIKEQRIDENQKVALVAKLLGFRADDIEMTDMIGKALGKIFTTHYFYYDKKDGYVHTKDISSLYPGDDDEMVAGWGGLTDYGARASDVVAEAVRMSSDE